MLHDPAAMKVRLKLVVVTGSGEHVTYEGEGVYSRFDDQPNASLSVAEPGEDVTPFGDPYARLFVGPSVAASCTVPDLRPTKPMTRTVTRTADHGPDALPHGYVEGCCTEECNNRECAKRLPHERCTEECDG
jgi:hypothetical protein